MPTDQKIITDHSQIAVDLRLSVIIPAYNEEGNIRPVIDETIRILSESKVIGSFEIIIVDDGSTDGSARESDALVAERPGIRAIHHSENRGIGAALKTGYAAARGQWVAAIGADGEIPATDVVDLMKLTPGADLVASTRQRPPGSGNRQLFSRIYHKLTNLLVGFDLSGMEGIYLIRRELLKDMELRSNTSLLNLEIIMQCVSRGYRIARGEMHVLPRLSGQSKMATWRSILKVIFETVKLRLALTRSRIRKKFKSRVHSPATKP